MSKSESYVNKQQFIEAVNNRLIKLFEKSKAGEKLVTEKAKVEGFMEAGKELGLISYDEGMELMDEAHVKIFGETMAARKASRGRVRQALEMDDFEYLEIPAINRK